MDFMDSTKLSFLPYKDREIDMKTKNDQQYFQNRIETYNQGIYDNQVQDKSKIESF